MAFNGHQHDADTIDDDDDQDGTPTKQPRSDTEGLAYWKAEPDDEAVGPAGRAAAAAGRASSSRVRQRSDSVKKTRPRTYYILQEGKGCVYLLETAPWREGNGCVYLLEATPGRLTFKKKKKSQGAQILI